MPTQSSGAIDAPLRARLDSTPLSRSTGSSGRRDAACPSPRKDTRAVGAPSPRSANYAYSQVRVDTGEVNTDPPDWGRPWASLSRRGE
jgi:hypothetical protein